jgi:hypothetical protein
MYCTKTIFVSFPITGKIPLGKVNFAAKADWEFTNNYKVLQQAFKTNNVDKVRYRLGHNEVSGGQRFDFAGRSCWTAC